MGMAGLGVREDQRFEIVDQYLDGRVMGGTNETARSNSTRWCVTVPRS